MRIKLSFHVNKTYFFMLKIKTVGLLLASMALTSTLAATNDAYAQTTPTANNSNTATFADPEKVLRTIFPVAETGFDPAAARDIYSNSIIEVVFERLYGYDYLASPAKIIPEAADGLPEISADGKTYTIKLKKGIYLRGKVL